MQSTKIRNLGQVRELLAELDAIRSDIIRGNVQAWAGLMRDSEGRDTVYMGGAFVHDSRAASKALMKITAARALLQQEPEPAVLERPRLIRV